MKVGIVTNAFQEENLIADCVEQFKDFKLHHLVLCNEISWNGNVENTRETGRIALNLGATALWRDFMSAEQQLNFGVDYLQKDGCEWIIICDADERWAEEDFSLLLKDLKNIPDNVTAVRSSNWDVYWKTDYRIYPPQTDYPLVAVRPYERFHNIRQPYGANIGWTNAKMHHFSYSRTDEDMWKKVQTFEAAKEFQVKAWYEAIWKQWTPEMTCLHPVNPPQFWQANYHPAPDGVRKVLSWD